MRNNKVWKVLIIEDERVDREIYKRYLQCSTAFQFEFAESDSAAGGIEISRRWLPDCILLDFNLPDMDGLEVLPRLCGEADRLPCAVVMLTAFGDEELAVNAMKRGAMDYLPKGHVSRDVLPHSVVNAIERCQMQQRIDEQRSALERSAQQYQTLLDAIPHMVWTTNTEGNMEYANSQWSEYTGLGIGKSGPLWWDDTLHPEDRERTRTAWNQARQAGSIFEIDHRVKRASDGSYRWHLVRAVPFRDGTGEIRNWYGTCTEIENQKQNEAENLQREKFQGIGRLAAGIAHDFNNLLVVILGGASYAMESLHPSHEAQGLLRGVVQAGERAAELTAKMLAYAGKGNLWIERTDLNKLVRDTCDSLRDAIPKTIQLNIYPGLDLPQVTTDSRQMRQVVTDLVMNAVEAIREGAAGTISVRTKAVEFDDRSVAVVAAGKYVELEVRDTGCGMNEETQKKIFDPFFSTKFAGRGLGLAAVHGCVRSNGGHVQVESSPGKGTCFRVLLPGVTVDARSRGVAS
jgi:two-component system, cell cycle sensor histidine kinase and response regulator CckA